MICLYQGGGAADFELFEPIFNQENWDTFTSHACKILINKGYPDAAQILKTTPFEPFDARNKFGDQFCVLYAALGIDNYVYFTKNQWDSNLRRSAQYIAQTVGEIIDKYIRFVVVQLDAEATPRPVPIPTMQFTTATVKKAINDAEQLMKTSGPSSALDRVHTAMHGYLKHICGMAKIQYNNDDNIASLFKKIRENNPAFTLTGAHGNEIRRVNNAMGVILDALNTLRNRASLSHPNEELLDEADAMLAINIAQTILHYIDSKIK